MAEIVLQGMDEVQRVVGKLAGPELDRAMRKATRKIGEQVRLGMQKYPGPANSPVIWASRKQRAWWFASRREAGLDPQYTRKSDPWSQRLQQSWVVASLGQMGHVVGTRATYAPYVQSQEFQTAQMAATGWQTDEDVVKDVERRGIIGRVVMAEISSLLEGL